MVRIVKNYYTKNRCYTNNRNYKKIGGIVHSTATPGVMADTFRDRWNNAIVAKAVHAFLDNYQVVECLPDTRQAWHVATTQGNNYYFGFEMCEDANHDKAYFLDAYRNAVEYAAEKSKIMGWTGKDWLSHKEANAKGFASNHGDPEHWWKEFGATMAMFRADVDKVLGGKEIVSGGVSDTTMNTGLKIDGYITYDTIIALQGYFGTIQDGKISKNSLMVKQMQKGLGITQDGSLDARTISALQKHLGTKIDGVISEPSLMVKELQRRLNLGNLNLKVAVKPAEPVVTVPEYERLLEDGKFGEATIKRLQQYLGTIQDGKISDPSNMVRELQKRLNNNKI